MTDSDTPPSEAVDPSRTEAGSGNAGSKEMWSSEYPENEVVSVNGATGRPEDRVNKPEDPDLIRKNEDVDPSMRGFEFFGSVTHEKARDNSLSRISALEKYPDRTGTRKGKRPPVSEYRRKSFGDAEPASASE